MVDITNLILVFLCIVVVIYLFYEVKRPYDFPPGPFWIPFVGNSSLIKHLSKVNNGFHKALIHLSHKYKTEILGLKLGADLFVVVFSKDLIKQVFTKDEFQARPDNFFIRLRTMGSRKGITMTDGLFWQEQRNFATLHLRNLGFGKAQMESLILEEFQDLIRNLKSQNEKNNNLSNQLHCCVLNVLWAFTAGSRFTLQDPQLTRLLDLMAQRSKAFDMAGGILGQLPFLAHIAPEWSGYNLICSLNAELKTLLEKTIDEHEKSLKAGVTRDFIDAFLHEIKSLGDQETSFTEEQLIMVCLDFFIAGSQTTSNTLSFALLNMILHQHVQERAYREIRKVLGDCKIPSLEDRHRLPYVEAVLLESQRFLHVVPVAGPRRVLWDTTLNGYNIPKNTTILLSLYSMHHDEELWDQPMTFQPERFLDENNKKLGDKMSQFGLGKRRCPGEALAKNFIFLFFIGILRNFHIDVPPGSNKPDPEPIPGITLSPRPFSVHLTPRND